MLKCIFLFLFLTGAVYGQTTYRLFEKNNCNGSVRQLLHFYAYKDTSQVVGCDIITNGLTFPDTGKYHIGKIEFLGGLKNYIDFHTVFIDGKSNEIYDTITAGLIDERFYMVCPPSYDYYCCDKKCDGNFISAYDNGKTKMIGSFKNGKPIGTLTQYYLNGNLMSISRYKGNWTFNKYFLSGGPIYLIYKTKKRKGLEIYLETKIYKEGKLMSHEINNKKGEPKKRKVYNNAGQVSEFRKYGLLKKYDVKGDLVLKAKRKRSFSFNNLCADYFKFWEREKSCWGMWEFNDFKFIVTTWDNGIKTKRKLSYFAEDQFFFPDNFDNPEL